MMKTRKEQLRGEVKHEEQKRGMFEDRNKDSGKSS
jgi:hypothetical protein